MCVPMPAITLSDPYETPSLARRIATPVLQGLSKFLPARAYDAVYRPAFSLYRAGLRSAYRRRLERVRMQGDQARVLCMERVYSVMDFSLVGAPGLEHTLELASTLIDRDLPGCFVECGVAQGGCAALMAQAAASEGRGRKCWFFDSYEGLPDPTPDDYQGDKTGHHVRPLPKGSCRGTYEEVSRLLFEHFRLSRRDITLVKGWFHETLTRTKSRLGSIALLRIDGDWYESTKCCLQELYPLVSPGGYVIIDDYYSCFGARRATENYLADHQIETALVADGRGGASFQKPVPHRNRVA